MIQAQDLSTHQWKQRLLLVISDESTLPLYQQQLAILQSDSNSLEERKLLIYQVLPQQYCLGETSWIKSDQLYRQYKKTDARFSVILIGLDGGVKLQRNSLLTSTELFAVIDGMPMRQAELRRKKRNQ